MESILFTPNDGDRIELNKLKEKAWLRLDELFVLATRDPAQKNNKLENSESKAISTKHTDEGTVFIAMPMTKGYPAYDDVHDNIKIAAEKCGFKAGRIDDVQDNERITDKMLTRISNAEYMVADLTDNQPNVFYEAGYAAGLGKTPIYVARENTHLEFDIKDYPVIFFQQHASIA